MKYILLYFSFIFCVNTGLAVPKINVYNKIDSLTSKAFEYRKSNADSALLLLEYAQRLVIDNNKLTLSKQQAEIDYVHAYILSNTTKNYVRANEVCDIAYAELMNLNSWEKAGWVCIFKSFVKFQQFHEIDSALFWAQRAIDLGRKAKSEIILLYGYQNSSTFLRAKNEISKALKLSWKALYHAEKTEDSNNLALAYTQLGELYFRQTDTLNAKKFREMAYKFSQNDQLDMSWKMYVWTEHAKMLNATGRSTEGIKLLEKVVRLCVKHHIRDRALLAYTELGNALINSNTDWEGAKEFFNKSLLISDSIGAKPAFQLISLARMYSLAGEHTKALEHVNDFINLHEDWNFQIDYYKIISTIYENAGIPDLALNYFKKWSTLSDSLRTQETRSMMADMEKKYELEKKDHQIADQRLELSQSHIKQLIMGISFSLVLLISVLIIIYQRNKAIREKQLYQLHYRKDQLKQIIDAQEAERTRIARELHDGIGQSLAALKLQLQNKAENTTKSSPNNSIVKVDMLCREVRSLSHRMMPLILEEKGLVDALHALIDQCFNQTGINAHFISNINTVSLDKTQQTHLYRIGQELIYNILKHANATDVGLQLLQNDDRIILIAEDNGVGFVKENNNKGIGLSNIKSRLDAMEGEIQIESGEEGSFIRVIIPTNPSVEVKIA